jgi:two-component system CheB/CheR fusion protein
MTKTHAPAKSKQPVSSQQFPVVGIGASAGGIEAFKLFLTTIPEKSGMAYVFVMHLSPVHDSYLPEILQKFTKIPVRLIADNVHLEVDHIYIIPPDKMLTTEDSVLKLQPIKNRKIKTIDLFFTSLGIVHQSFAVGVVLSGALDDGTVGLQVIKSYGGVTFAQEEATAAFDSMPRSAIKSGAVDFVLPADQIVPKLVSINLPFPVDYTVNDREKNEPEQDEEVFRQLLTVLRIRKGVDFTNYKQSTIKRRIVRCMALSKFDKPQNYLAFLRESKSEQDALYNDLLISVTSFFRDPKSFDFLCHTVFPAVLNQKAGNEPLRIWVAGCATGEEAYSIGICVQEYLGEKAVARKVQIFATDVSETAIAKARMGVYSHKDLEGFTPQQLQQFFNKLDGSYQVNKVIRDMCVFAHHNILKDPPFSKIDLVSCRNVMIYLEPVLQKRVFSTFHYALNEKGYLMLGKSETIGNNTDLFIAFNQHEKIYQSKGAHGKLRSFTSARSEQALKDSDQHIKDKSSEKDIRKKAEAILLDKFTLSSVIVNQAYDIVEFCGETETWLALPKRKPNFNILKIAREGLSFEIRNLIHLAKTKQLAVRKEGIFFRINDEQQYVNIEVVPLPDDAEDYYLIVFQNSMLTVASFLPDTGNTSNPQENINAWIQRVEQLERELTQTREDMRAITEVQEAANEELQSANEELLSGSEELQSLNEELETSKEELQSTNEEIIIVNTELLDRNEQLNNSRRYTEEIFNTIHDPLLILNKELEVIRATNTYYQLFKVSEEETEGKFLYDLGNKQWDISSLRYQLEKVLPERGSFKTFEVDHVFNNLGRRVMQLTARRFDTYTQEKLTLLAIHDITDKRKVEEGLAEVERLLEESKERMHFAIESAGIGTWDYNPVTGELVWDNQTRRLFGMANDDPINYAAFLAHVHPDDRSATDEAVNKTLNESNEGGFNIAFRLTAATGQKPRWIKSKGKAYFNKEKKAVRFIGTIQDISMEKAMEENIKELLRKKDEFMSIASHELKTPITSIRASLQILDRSVSQKEELKSVYSFVQKANNQVNKLTDLIKDLLDVTRIQEGKLDLNKSNFAIKKLVEECCEEITVKNKECKIDINGPEDQIVYADKNRIEQVLVNLINNAVKYAPDSNLIKINITKELELVKIAVTDFGIGIPKEKAPFIFDRFFRVEETSKNYSGLGLGLFISSEIVRGHNGTIGLTSELTKGSTFWFTIPAKKK